MVGCNDDADCPFMFYCNPNNSCQHSPIFPIQWYPALVYLLIPIGAGFVNVVGKSMGILKITILMNLLRYNASESTALIQPMVAGAALPNVLNVIFKRHPKRNTSLVDYDIILVIIPCSLLGSTLGSFLEKLIPELAKDIIMMLFFISFAYGFYKKSQTFKKPNPPPSSQPQSNQTLTQPLQSQSSQSNPDPQSHLPLTPQLSTLKQQILQYEQSHHFPDIALSLLVFLVFEFLVFLVQGKFGFYRVKVCSWELVVGLAVLVGVVICYEEVVRKKLMARYGLYRELGIRRNIDFSVRRNFGLICFGGYFAGLAQGILGVGSGTFIMGVFMAIKLDPRVAAATSSYQILFVGIAAFIEQFITNSIKIEDALFLFLLTSIGGGVLTFVLYHIFKKFQDRKVNIFLVYVMFGLCLISAIFVVPFLVQLGIEFGIGTLIQVPFHC